MGNAVARADGYAPRIPEPGSSRTPVANLFVGGATSSSPERERPTGRAGNVLLRHGITPAMSEAKPGTGIAYAAVHRDGAGNYLDGGHLLGDPAGTDSRQQLLGLHCLRQPDPLAPAHRTSASAGVDSLNPELKKNGSATGGLAEAPPGQSRTEFRRCGTRLLRPPAALRPARTLVHQVMAAGRPVLTH